jgi:hypothetical protein
VLEGKEVPARRLAQRELRPHPGEPHAPHHVRIRAADERRGHAQAAQVAHHVVRDRAVDLVFDQGVDLQLRPLFFFTNPCCT